MNDTSDQSPAPPPLPAWRRWTAYAIHLLIGALFMYAAWTKFQPPYPLDIPQLRTIFDDTFPPGSLRRDIIIAFEFTLGLWLITGWFPRMAQSVAAVVLLGFSGVMIHELTQPDPRACGCLPVDPNTLQALDPHAMLRSSLTRNAIALCLL
ncbi:MAG TPA: DoxX family protein, partial [Tepidisphaeraceae bacterium]|nr:DoxX family protein [Tepidisphaeraceae bacterium]